uniref:Cornifelin homolog n=1 Tax=Phascolarctos cinereus TaxID=38626 RepID=A0A6P5LU21_PHACI|nr:cornifelin homolog [Phascolarctos cinereus]
MGELSPSSVMSFYKMSHFSFFSQEAGSSRDLHPLDTSYTPKPCHLELYSFQEPIVGVNGALLPCLLACFVADTQGECCCLPYLPGALVAMRTSLRVTQGIQGSIAEDWLVMCCCPVCGLCQMAHQYNSSII